MAVEKPEAVREVYEEEPILIYQSENLTSTPETSQAQPTL